MKPQLHNFSCQPKMITREFHPNKIGGFQYWKQCYVLMCLMLLLPYIAITQVTQVRGRIIDSNSSEPVEDVDVQIAQSPFAVQTSPSGLFSIADGELPLGEQVLILIKAGYVKQRLSIIINQGETLNIEPILLEIDLTEIESQIGVISLTDNELDQDEGASFNVSGLLQAGRDVFLSAAAFDFSASFFRPRGFDNNNGKLLINGLEMNKFDTGRPQWSNWGGLNDVQRNREFSQGLNASDYAFGDIGGITNINMRASSFREGGRVSFGSSNRSYVGRIMATYNSGMLENGWAYSISASRRYGDEGYQDATLYDANALFLAVEKRFNDNHSLNFSALYTPNRRGRATPITQEMADLKGIRYNPNWGFFDGQQRNSRIREIVEPIFTLNHFWDLANKTSINTNIGFQTGRNGQTRLDNGGTRLVVGDNGEESFIGGARNPFGNYYQRLPSFALSRSQTTADFANAFLLQREFVEDGQLDWQRIYQGNAIARENGGNSIYAIQEDRVDDTMIMANAIVTHLFNNHVTFNGNVSIRSLKSENFAELKDLLGGTGYLDVDFFAGDNEGNQELSFGDVAQSDLNNRNRIVGVGDRYKYNYEMDAFEVGGFAQAQFNYSKIDFFTAISGGTVSYQRTGLYENGYFPGSESFGESEQLNFINFGLKAGGTYKITGRHLLNANVGVLQNAPTIRNSFSNARISNATTIGIEEEKITNADLSYIFRGTTIKAKATAYYANFKDGADIGFYFTENISGQGLEQDAFVQEVMTNIGRRHLGVELGIEAQILPTLKLKAAAGLGQYTFTNNPNLYLTSDDLEGVVTFGDGTAKLKDYHVASGPETVAQIGFEYRDPKFWWIGVSTNYFANGYIDVNNLSRSDNFTLDFDGNTFNDFDPDLARELLRQEQFDDYMLVNVVGGKSWKVDQYYFGFFATINNVFDQRFTTGGFEQGRTSNFRDIRDDTALENGRVFGPRYFFGNGTTYFLNVYFSF